MVQAHVGQRPALEQIDTNIAHANFPAVGRIESADCVQQGGFAGARRTRQADKLAFLDGDVDVVEAGMISSPWRKVLHNWWQWIALMLSVSG